MDSRSGFTERHRGRSLQKIGPKNAEVIFRQFLTRLWEERRLAYPINGQRKGTYWLTYFRLDGKQVGALQRECRLSESIIRSLVIKIDPRIVDTLVSYATAGAPTPSNPTGDGNHRPH